MRDDDTYSIHRQRKFHTFASCYFGAEKGLVWSARACGPLGGRWGLRVEAVDEARSAAVEALLGVGDERQQRPPRARPRRHGRRRGGRVGRVHRGGGRTARGARKWGSVKNCISISKWSRLKTDKMIHQRQIETV